jgi:hypothetical protein
MKFVVGIVSGIVLSGMGVAAVVTSGAAATPAAQVAPARTAHVEHDMRRMPSRRPVATSRRASLVGELKVHDGGVLELKIAVRRVDGLDDQDVRLLVRGARIVGRYGRPTSAPLDEARARVLGRMLPRSRWAFDSDGRLVPTFAASQLRVLAAAPVDQGD